MILQRSQLEAHGDCPRRGYWGYFHGGRGIERKAVSVPLLTGSMVHEPLAEVLMLAKLNGEPPQPSSLNDIVRQAYIAEVQGRGLLLDSFDGSDQQVGTIESSPVAWQVNEQLALIEALVKGWTRVRLPRLLEEFEIIDVEAEQAFQLGPHTMLTRRDGLLRRRSSGEFYVLSFKTTSNADATWREEHRYKQQTISEFVAADVSLKEQGIEGVVRGVIVEGLVKGQRTIVWPEGSEQRRHNSPLIYHYVEQGQAPFPDTYKASQYYRCPEPHPWRWVKGGQCPGSKTHKIPDSYQRNMVAQTCGIDAWLDWLAANDPQTLEAQFISLPAILRSDYEVERWKRQTVAIADDLEGRLAEFNIAGGDEEALDRCFPLNTSHCLRPSRCSYLDLCWGSGDPNDREQFVPRRYNHPQEEKLVQIQIGAAK